MEAKDAPKKVYLTVTENGHYYTEGKPFERECTEYVRKDIFIEKAWEYFAPYINDNSGGYDRAFVLEGFKNYMER